VAAISIALLPVVVVVVVEERVDGRVVSCRVF